MALNPVTHNTDTRDRILNAAVDTFAVNGFRCSSISSIARMAGVNDVTVYRYFPRKERLYWAAVDHKLRSSGIVESLVRLTADAQEPLSYLEFVITKSIEELEQDPALARLLNFTLLELEKEKSLLFRFYLRPILQALTTRIAEWTERGAIRQCDAESVAMAMIGSIIAHYTLRQLFGYESHSTFTLQQLASQYADICVAGLSPGTPVLKR